MASSKKGELTFSKIFFPENRNGVVETEEIDSFRRFTKRFPGWQEANFAGANLSGADFTGANLSGANLSKTNLHYTKASGANFTGAVFMKL